MLGGTAGGDAEDGGGQEEGTLPGAARPGGGAGPGKGHPQPKGKATAAMAVDKFLEKGVGGAQLPRKRCVRGGRRAVVPGGLVLGASGAWAGRTSAPGPTDCC